MSHGYEMYSVGNIVNNYVISLYGDNGTSLNMVIILKCREILNHYVVYPELTQYCQSITFQKQTNKPIEKEIRFMFNREGGLWGEGGGR